MGVVQNPDNLGRLTYLPAHVVQRYSVAAASLLLSAVSVNIMIMFAQQSSTFRRGALTSPAEVMKL